MADRRSVRSASRRNTPTPQPPSKPPAHLGRASRARSLRSASREVDGFVEIQKPARRTTRQASITSVNYESEHETKQARRTERNPANDALGDLTVVEEIDTQIDLDDERPRTPEPTHPEIPVSFRSPGAVSEMSGTTAISSFSMAEAEFLESKFIVKHMRKLCDAAEEFLEHIAPSSATMRDDLKNIQEMQKPGSAYSEDYLDYEIELHVHLKHFKSEDHNYIHARALHRALFGTNEQPVASQTGLDLILYLANLLVFAKQMIYSDRDHKTMWDVLRQLDNTFPAQFMRSLQLDGQPSVTGESALYRETFELALELRTQLAILVLQKSVDNPDFNPDAMVSEIFFRSELSQAVDGSLIRGWNIAALGGDDSPLPQELQKKVVARLNKIREFFPTDKESLERGELIDLEGLRSSFPWEPTILRLLAWVRLRRKELLFLIEERGGAATIARNIKRFYEEPSSMIEQAEASMMPHESPRRKRTSFGRDRRRSSRKFDPNAAVDFRTIDVLKAKERDSVNLEVDSQEEQDSEPVEQAAEEQPSKTQLQDDEQPAVEADEQQAEEEQVEEQQVAVQPAEQSGEEQGDKSQAKELVEEEDEAEAPTASGKPQSSAELLKMMKAVSKPQKENRPVSIFERQANAQRVEFGDGFDETQPTPGPSNTDKGKQPAASSRKRSRPMDDDSDSDAFESEDRGHRVPERRRKAPVAKKVRIDSSSSVPPSYQPRRPTQETQRPPEAESETEPEESVSETEAPDMTEEIPSSNYQAQRQLAQENQSLNASTHRNERKPRRGWTPEAEDALCEYMRMFPAKYSAILKYDESNGNFLQGRTQVNLKDKVRNMALNMIKSGTGLRPGFENIVHPKEKHGMALVASGWRMRDDGQWVRR
ncbi:uncharacterized protein SETTUDRAFT_140618 [Exserohilum turcica Et28A]|uniref:Uncharacterized protein n=1 Tax=Exserohilum turcicum (strain 28A) TaxID=671987 RepID=R0K264_EXST2|nr:uncharacterized protein SETTUDRAFT_140618 [Exserohilum turcica Et28A]EOA82497.1 hypothetical protein SETTUDRAFT_140618 [Exserohilum turcica Et28A]